MPNPAAIPGEKLDRAGATASFLCAIHCAVMPFLISVLPLLGLEFLASEPVEWTLLATSAMLGTLSLCLGYRQHRRRWIFGFLGVALSLLALGHILEARDVGRLGPISLILGGLTMMGAHLFNRRLCRSCHVCPHTGCSP